MRKMCLECKEGWRLLKLNRRILYFVLLYIPSLYRKILIYKDPTLINWEKTVKKAIRKN